MKRRRSAMFVTALCGLTLIVTAAGAGATAPPADTGAPADSAVPGRTDAEFTPLPIDWHETDSDGVTDGTLEVPVDYANPEGAKFTIYVARHSAANPSERIGTLLVNPGGPGSSGSELAFYADAYYSSDLVDRFDIVAWDPRGTGATEPAIDCIDDLDAVFSGTDITPDDDAERGLLVERAESFAAACVEQNADIIDFVGTNNSARDMDSIRRALGEEQISYFGWSYGSELGATWATLFPETARAIVLDGSTDPSVSTHDESIEQNKGFEQVLNTFLAGCSAESSCEFHNDGDAEGAFDQLMSKIDAKPLPTLDGRPPLTRSMALTGAAQAMYSASSWPTLALALKAAQDGDGEPLLALYDAYSGYLGTGEWTNLLEAFQTITCMDTDERSTVAEEDELSSEFRAIAPRIAPGTAGSYFCSFFPTPADPRAEITGAGAGPILVCGSTGDAPTPIAATKGMADSLQEGHLLVVDSVGHTCYLNDSCGAELIDAYLVDPAALPEQDACGVVIE